MHGLIRAGLASASARCHQRPSYSSAHILYDYHQDREGMEERIIGSVHLFLCNLHINVIRPEIENRQRVIQNSLFFVPLTFFRLSEDGSMPLILCPVCAFHLFSITNQMFFNPFVHVFVCVSLPPFFCIFSSVELSLCPAHVCCMLNLSKSCSIYGH